MEINIIETLSNIAFVMKKLYYYLFLALLTVTTIICLHSTLQIPILLLFKILILAPESLSVAYFQQQPKRKPL